MFYKLDNNNILVLFVTVIVDDCAITGTNDNIEWFMNGVDERFNITKDNVTSKHLGVNYV